MLGEAAFCTAYPDCISSPAELYVCKTAFGVIIRKNGKLELLVTGFISVKDTMYIVTRHLCTLNTTQNDHLPTYIRIKLYDSNPLGSIQHEKYHQCGLCTALRLVFWV